MRVFVKKTESAKLTIKKANKKTRKKVGKNICTGTLGIKKNRYICIIEMIFMPHCNDINISGLKCIDVIQLAVFDTLYSSTTT